MSDCGIGTAQTGGKQKRLAVVGCGAVVRLLHFPVLAGHAGVIVAALVDKNLAAAQSLAAQYRIGTAHADLSEVDLRGIDCVLLATPPRHHAQYAIDLLRRGVSVFVEKPMAITTAEATEMVNAAREAKTVLAAGYFRRLFPATGLMKALIDSQVLGEPLSFQVTEGAVRNWPCESLGPMVKETAGGGVLIDTGSHTIDQLVYFLSGAAEVLEYEDNSWGGVESDCRLRLRILHKGKAVEGTVELSRTRNLANVFRIRCEHGTLELPTRERCHVSIQVDQWRLKDPLKNDLREYTACVGWKGVVESPIYAAFRAAIDDWLQAIDTGAEPVLSGASAVPTVRIIEECYRKRRRLVEVWVEEGLGSGSAGAMTDTGCQSSIVQRAPAVHAGPGASRGRVLVTGAAGFIGCRVAELLVLREGYSVRALVHRPGGASRLARLPVDLFHGDLRKYEEVLRAVDGCDAVVHAAYGTEWGDQTAIYDVTVKGTQRLAHASLKACVDRFVHLSTWAVHGKRLQGVVDEATPVMPPKSDWYAQTKARAEDVLARATAAGLPTVILRLTNVYGPFSRPFTVRPVEHLLASIPVLVGTGDTPSNTVYVDNVGYAIIRALQCDRASVAGHSFLICDEDLLSWRDFHGYYAEALGVPMHAVPLADFVKLRSNRSKRFRPVAGSLDIFRACKEILMSPEALQLARRFYTDKCLGTLPRVLIERLPGLKRRLRHVLRLDTPVVYSPSENNTPPPLSLDLLELYACQAHVSIAKARRVLGYGSVLSRARAMELTIEWVRSALLAQYS